MPNSMSFYSNFCNILCETLVTFACTVPSLSQSSCSMSRSTGDHPIPLAAWITLSLSSWWANLMDNSKPPPTLCKPLVPGNTSSLSGSLSFPLGWFHAEIGMFTGNHPVIPEITIAITRTFQMSIMNDRKHLTYKTSLKTWFVLSTNRHNS